MINRSALVTLKGMSLLQLPSPDTAAPAVIPIGLADRAHSIPRRRGVSWVLQNAAIVAVLGFTAAHVMGVVCLAVAERKLSQAAAAAAMAATLPKASAETVFGEAWRQLQRTPPLGLAATVEVYCNGRPCRDALHPGPGDHVGVEVTAPGRSALPTLLARLTPWLADEQIKATTEVRIPTR